MPAPEWRPPQEAIDMKFFVSLLVLALIPMMALNDLGRPAFIGYYLGVITLWLVLVGASVRAARVPTTGS